VLPSPPQIIFLLGSIFLIGCEPEVHDPGPQANHPPSIRSARISPNPVMLNGPVFIEVQGEDLDQDPLIFRCRWHADDQILQETTTRLDTQLIKRGMRLWAEVVAFDGKAESARYRIPAVTVGNTPPAVRSVMPEAVPVKVGDRLRMKIESVDADDDSIEYTYRWWRNTTLVAEGDQAELDTAGFARGDTVFVEVTPHDRAGAGRPLMSDQILIENNPPIIRSSPPNQIDQGRYHYAVMAVDADGDPLSYTLEAAPSGMTIDKTSGRIEWQISVGMKGPQRVKVLVDDGQNGQAFQEFELTPVPRS
jgi:putative Ig domain-containing protein